MKRPAFQFYPADWRNNANLRRCSAAARGAWMDVLCVLHDSDIYGVVHWPLAELASAAGAPMRLVKELVDKRVLKGCDKGDCEALIYTPRSGRKDGEPVTLVATQPGPVWYSSRFVRDEYVRTIRGESSRFGETPKDAPKTTFGDGSTSSSSPSGGSEANASAGPPAGKTPEAKAPKTADDLTKEEIWRAGKSLLMAADVPKDQCGSFLGKLVQDYTAAIVVQAVRAAVVAPPADPREYLKATCQRLKGERKDPITVGSDEASHTAEYLAEQQRIAEEAKSPASHAAREAAMAKFRGKTEEAAA